MAHNHHVGLNCANLERLVKMLQAQLKKAQDDMEQLLGRKTKTEMECKQLEENANSLQKDLEKSENLYAQMQHESKELGE